MAKSSFSFDFDFDKFQKNIESEYQKMMGKAEIQVTCPNCDNSFLITKGVNQCPDCNQEINLDTTLKF